MLSLPCLEGEFGVYHDHGVHREIHGTVAHVISGDDACLHGEREVGPPLPDQSPDGSPAHG